MEHRYLDVLVYKLLLPGNKDLKTFLLMFSMHESDDVTHLKRENDEERNNLKYFFHILFPNKQILNKIMARGRYSLVLVVEMDHFRYCTDNFLGVESVAHQNQPNKKSAALS